MRSKSHFKTHRMETTQTHAARFQIRTVKPLSAKMLDTQAAGRKTLRQFLSQDCASLSTGKHAVYTTTKISAFKRLKENRSINEAHVLALMDSFEKDGYLFTIIYVNEKLEIIDGQHRCEAAKRSNLPIYFMVMPGWGIKEVTILNVNSRDWGLGDFLESHAKSGNPNYIRFLDFYKSHKFDITTCQLLLYGKRSGQQRGSDEFRLGLIQVDDKHVTDAHLKAKKIATMKPFHPHGWKCRGFVDAMLTLFKTTGYDHEYMLSKLQAHPDILLAQAKSMRTEEYLRLLLDKYNFKLHRNRIEIRKVRR